MMHPKNPPESKSEKIKRDPRNGKQSTLRDIHLLEYRILEEAQKAKGQALSALCRAFDLLENRKRLLRGKVHPDVLARGYSNLGGNRKAAPKSGVAPGDVAQPFPEPRDPGDNPTPNDQPELAGETLPATGETPGETPGRKNPGDTTGEGIYFSGQG